MNVDRLTLLCYIVAFLSFMWGLTAFYNGRMISKLWKELAGVHMENAKIHREFARLWRFAGGAPVPWTTDVRIMCSFCEGVCKNPYECPHCHVARPCMDGSHCQNCYRSNDPDNNDHLGPRELGA